MRKILTLGCAGMFLCLVSGCGGNAEGLLKEEINLINQLAESIEKGEPEAKRKDIQTKLEENHKKLDAIKLPKAEQDKLMEKYQGDMLKAVMRLAKASQEKGVQGIDQLMKGLGK
jgi:hypothetical protein